MSILHSVLQATGSVVALKKTDVHQDASHAETIQQALIDLVVYIIDVHIGETNYVDSDIIHAGILAVLARDFTDDNSFAKAAQNSFDASARRSSEMYRAAYFKLVEESRGLKEFSYDKVNQVYLDWVTHGPIVP